MSHGQEKSGFQNGDSYNQFSDIIIMTPRILLLVVAIL